MTPPERFEQTPLPIPWTESYNERRQEVLLTAVRDRSLIASFASCSELPAGYGRGIDERCVEYPWLLSQLPPGPARLLDAGSTLNNALLLDVPQVAEKTLHIVTLEPEADAFWQRGISYLYEDLRSLPIRDNTYDIVVSISSLEHVGCDNTFYTQNPAHVEARPQDFELAARELIRVLKPGGLLLVTVPYGVYQFHGAFQQFDRNCLARLEDATERALSRLLVFYRYTRDGWRLSTAEQCDGSEYVAWVAEYMKSRVWPDPGPEPDDAAAARAVACMAIRKARN